MRFRLEALILLSCTSACNPLTSLEAARNFAQTRWHQLKASTTHEPKSSSLESEAPLPPTAHVDFRIAYLVAVPDTTAVRFLDREYYVLDNSDSLLAPEDIESVSFKTNAPFPGYSIALKLSSLGLKLVDEATAHYPGASLLAFIDEHPVMILSSNALTTHSHQRTFIAQASSSEAEAHQAFRLLKASLY